MRPSACSSNAIGRGARVEREAIAVRQELRAGGGRGEQIAPRRAALVGLMHMAPGDGAHMRVRVDDAPEIVGVGKADAIEPAAAHGDRVMMQAHHGVRGASRRARIEAREFRRGQASADVSRIVAVQHDEIPGAEIMRAADTGTARRPTLAHRLGLVVVAGNAQHRFLQAAEDAAKAQIAADCRPAPRSPVTSIAA